MYICAVVINTCNMFFLTIVLLDMKFLLVHDSSIRVDSIKTFFFELYEHFIKVNQFTYMPVHV